ncbi:MAG: HNH endonuclease [Proteobacteria bacterium]|nr:HNH endonuclease [Pseudomonadota bacterium]
MEGELDYRMRCAAFEHVHRLNATHDYLSSRHLAEGFTFEGVRIPLVNPQRGIFKPKQMQNLLSIRTVFPRPGAKVWYDDQRQVHRQIYQSQDLVDYAFMGTNPDAADNRWLKAACEQRIPIIYFIGVAPGRFVAQVPAFIARWDRSGLKASVGFAESATATGMAFADTQPARRYALNIVKQRLHQATFRQAVLTAYGERCALSGLPEPMLLDAAHIVSDKHEVLGQPIVPNGIPLSKIHHAAFDAHLIGIDPDFRLHVSPRLMEQSDGPMLEALKQLHDRSLRLPVRQQDLPDRNRLALRFEEFRSAN